MGFVTEIIECDSYNENDCESLENRPFNRKRKGDAGIFGCRERKEIPDEMDFLCSQKMLCQVFRGLVEEDEEGENEGEHRNISS